MSFESQSITLRSAIDFFAPKGKNGRGRRHDTMAGADLHKNTCNRCIMRSYERHSFKDLDEVNEDLPDVNTCTERESLRARVCA